MILTLIAIVVFIIFLINDILDNCDYTLSIIFGIILFIFIIAIPISNRITDKGIRKTECLQNILNEYRSNKNNEMQFEKATITLKTMEYNEWLIDMKYGEDHKWVNWYISNKIKTTKLIK